MTGRSAMVGILYSLRDCDKVGSMGCVDQTIVIVLVMIQVAVKFAVVDPNVGGLL